MTEKWRRKNHADSDPDLDEHRILQEIDADLNDLQLIAQCEIFKKQRDESSYKNAILAADLKESRVKCGDVINATRFLLSENRMLRGEMGVTYDVETMDLLDEIEKMVAQAENDEIEDETV